MNIFYDVPTMLFFCPSLPHYIDEKAIRVRLVDAHLAYFLVLLDRTHKSNFSTHLCDITISFATILQGSELILTNEKKWIRFRNALTLLNDCSIRNPNKDYLRKFRFKKLIRIFLEMYLIRRSPS